MDSIRQMRRIAVEVMQLLALTNWAPSEEPQKCCLEDISGGLQFSPHWWVPSRFLALTSPSWGLPLPWPWNRTSSWACSLTSSSWAEQKEVVPVGDLASPSLRASSCASCTSPWTSCSALLLSWEAPRWWMQLLLWIIWPGIMMGFFFLACVAPSSSSVSSDCVVLAVSLPTLAQLERGAGQGHWCWLCVSVCLSVLTRCGVAVPRCVCVCTCTVHTCVCTWPKPAHPNSSWSCRHEGATEFHSWTTEFGKS